MNCPASRHYQRLSLGDMTYLRRFVRSLADNKTENVTIGHGNGTGQHGDEEGEAEIELAGWNYDYVAAPLLLCSFIIMAGLFKILFHHTKFLSRFVPESCLLIIVGILMGVILHFSGAGDLFKLTPQLFFLYLLPPIVLESAYSLHDREFAENLGTIMLYAVVGTLINYILIGPLLYGLAVAGAMGDINISLVQCLLFSSFIVAVDPVAVLAIFQEVGVNNVLYFLLFGESLLNDGVTVVISDVMKVFSEQDHIPPEDVGLGILAFFTVSLGGVAIGILFGIFTALMTRLTSHVRVVEPLAVLILGYMSYICADLFHWSGIISCIVCGLVQAQYSFHNISHKSFTTVKYFIKMLSSTADSIIFMFLGLELVRSNHHWQTGFIVWAVFLCLVVRLISVFGLTFLANRTDRLHKISYEEQYIMWYGGLRGAVCFALVETINDDFEHKELFITTTLVVIMFTVFVQGTTIKPFVRLCKIQRKSEESLTLFEEVSKRMTDHLMAGVEVMAARYGENRLRAFIFEFNERYLRKVFQKDPMTHDEKILAVYKKILSKDHNAVIGRAHPKLTFTASTQMEQDLTMHVMQDFPQEKDMEIPTVVTEDLTTEGLRDLLAKSRTSNYILHQNYDPNLTRDTDNNLLTALTERRRRLRRYENHKRKTRLRFHSADPPPMLSIPDDGEDGIFRHHYNHDERRAKSSIAVTIPEHHGEDSGDETIGL